MPPRGPSKQPRKGKTVRNGDTLQTVFEVSEAPAKATTSKATTRKKNSGPEPANTGASPGQQLATQDNSPNAVHQGDDLFSPNTGLNTGSTPVFPSPAAEPSSPPTETINIDVSSTSSDDGEPPLPVMVGRRPTEPRPTNQQRRSNSRSLSPRSGPHSRPSSSRTPSSPGRPPHIHKTSGPAGNRNHHEAQDVWTFFRAEEDKAKGKKYRHCVLCEKLKSVTPAFKVKVYSSTTSTSTLRKHLADNHFTEWVDSCDERKIPISETLNVYSQVLQHRSERDGQQNTQPSNNPGVTERPEFSKEAFVDAICDFVISDDQSINVIENPELRAIFLMLRSELQDKDIPHRTTLRQRILERLDEYLERLSKDMKSSLGKISFTMDMWSDGNLTPFMGVTAHWIHATPISTHQGTQYKLEMRTDLIGFQRVPGRHTGEHLSVAFLAILDRLQITSKIGWATMDNATNNDKFCSVLERELHMRKIPFDKIKNRVRCFPHIVNLACKAVLSAVTSIQLAEANAPDYEPPSDSQYVTDILDALQQDPVASIRSAVRNIRNSSLRRQHFSEIVKTIPNQEDLQLIKDVDTRWSSTLLMIIRALDLKEPMIRFLSENPDLEKYQLSDTEWEALDVVKQILMVPHAFQQILSFEKVPTLGLTIPAFQSMIIAWEELQSEMPEVSPIIQAGLDKLEGYQERLDLVPANIFATLLHPQFRLRFFQDKMPDTVTRAKRMFIDELRPYFTQENPVSGKPQKDKSSWASKLLRFDSPTEALRGRSLEEEVDAYFLDTSSTMDSVQFWQDNQLRWPTLFKLALDILPIQGSAVPCERIFSSAKETTTVRRNRIKPLLMEALQILKFAIKNGHTLDFMKGVREEEQLRQMELEGINNSSVPENLASYRVQLQRLFEEDEDIEEEEEGEKSGE